MNVYEELDLAKIKERVKQKLCQTTMTMTETIQCSPNEINSDAGRPSGEEIIDDSSK